MTTKKYWIQPTIFPGTSVHHITWFSSIRFFTWTDYFDNGVSKPFYAQVTNPKALGWGPRIKILWTVESQQANGSRVSIKLTYKHVFFQRVSFVCNAAYETTFTHNDSLWLHPKRIILYLQMITRMCFLTKVISERRPDFVQRLQKDFNSLELERPISNQTPFGQLQKKIIATQICKFYTLKAT